MHDLPLITLKNSHSVSCIMCAALGLMISLAIVWLAMGKRADPPPPLARLSGIPIILGVSTYISKCQHYLPGIVTPMKSKRGIFIMFFITFVSAQAFYMTLSYTGSFSFSSDELFDLYTLNFFKPFNIHDRAYAPVTQVNLTCWVSILEHLHLFNCGVHYLS